MGTDKIRYYLNIIFIVLAIASVLLYDLRIGNIMENG